MVLRAIGVPRLATAILHLSSNLFFLSRPVLSYLMEMNSGSRKPFCDSKSFALSKASDRHEHPILLEQALNCHTYNMQQWAPEV